MLKNIDLGPGYPPLPGGLEWDDSSWGVDEDADEASGGSSGGDDQQGGGSAILAALDDRLSAQNRLDAVCCVLEEIASRLKRDNSKTPVAARVTSMLVKVGQASLELRIVILSISFDLLHVIV